MALVEVDLPVLSSEVPRETAEFIAEARARIESFMDENRAPAFVASDFEPVYAALSAVSRSNLAPGNVFCEWGSGFGVVAGLASRLGFESYGIEIDPPLVDLARQLAADYSHPVRFVCGSFIPEGAEQIVDRAVSSDVFWLNTEADDAYEEMGLDPDDFDLVFAYPWPGEDDVITGLFDHCAAQGALLLTYSYLDGVRAHRRV